MLVLGIAMIFIISPILTYRFGKRWYCSWVCGCGGLAETAGDPYRHLSDKSVNAWKIERWIIHGVLVFVTVTTAAVIFSLLRNNAGQFWIGKNSFSIFHDSIFLGDWEPLFTSIKNIYTILVNWHAQ